MGMSIISNHTKVHFYPPKTLSFINSSSRWVSLYHDLRHLRVSVLLNVVINSGETNSLSLSIMPKPPLLKTNISIFIP